MNSVLEIVFEVRLQMLLGVALFPALEKILDGHIDPFAKNLRIWVKKRIAGQASVKIFAQHPVLVKTAGRRALLMVLERGLIGGSPIDGALQELQSEFMLSMETQFEKRLQILPLKLLIPLTVFILPGVISLIVGPLMFSLTLNM